MSPTDTRRAYAEALQTIRKCSFEDALQEIESLTDDIDYSAYLAEVGRAEDLRKFRIAHYRDSLRYMKWDAVPEDVIEKIWAVIEGKPAS